MSDDFDVDGDWKKARGFLVTFSAIVLLAWYFSADLSTVSILGFSLKTRENAEHIWAVIALVNIYFIFRYIQKFPADQKLPDDATRTEFEAVLLKNYLKNYHEYLFRHVERIIRNESIYYKRTSPPVELISIRPRATMKYRDEYNAASEQNEHVTLEKCRMTYKNIISIRIPYTYKSESISQGHSSGRLITSTPDKYLVLYAKTLGFMRGFLLTPWMADYILPLILGAASVVVSLISWYTINHSLLLA